jgi:putative transposase
MPDGFVMKQATILRKADGWYVNFSLENGSVPEPMPVDALKVSVGIDVGLEKFLTTLDGQAVEVPQYF